jgi:Tol biopolymer transport system component/DNA-binding winged helix-turn-helix (wHTH) protein
MTKTVSDIYVFGEFQLNLNDSVLWKGKEIVRLTPKAVEVLKLLVRNRGRVVSRTEMIETLWPDAFVEESNLTVTVSMLRQALGDSENGAAFIETIPKRGYRFVPAVQTQSKAVPAVDFSRLEIIRITHDGRVLDVCISPDASLLAYVPIESGKHSLWIRNLKSNETHELLPHTPALCWGVQFAPDGRSLYFITTPPGSTISELYSVSLEGGEPEKLVVNIDSPVAFSPDGKRMAFVRCFPGQHKDSLIVANVDGSHEQELSVRAHPNKFTFCSPSWSPDGTLIAIGGSRNNELEFAILAIPTSGAEPYELSTWMWKDLRAVAWNEVGTRLYCSAMSANANSLQIWCLSYPGGATVRITNDPNNYEELSVAAHAPAMVTMEIEALADIWIKPPGASARRITSGHSEGYYGLATAGDRIIFASSKNQQSDLWSINSDGMNLVRLTERSGSFPTVSADGRFLCYVSSEGGTLHIWHMHTDGSNKRQLTDGEGESYPCISPDGSWVVYSPRGEARNTLWRISTAGGSPVQLTYQGLAIKPVISPDGERIACTYRLTETGSWNISILSADDGHLIQSLKLPYPFNQILRWTSDGKALNYLERRKGTYNIWRLVLDGTSSPQQITDFTEDAILYYDWLADGTLVASRGEKTRDIVLIKNFE